jgi:hypothetical protein
MTLVLVEVRIMHRPRRFVFLVALVSLFLPRPGLAQSAATGAIAGTVRDTTGALLPGVNVEAASSALIEKVRSVVTDGQGNYKIIDLRPGIYSVTYTLQGFTSVKREGIELTTSFTATVNAEMNVGTVAADERGPDLPQLCRDGGTHARCDRGRRQLFLAQRRPRRRRQQP